MAALPSYEESASDYGASAHVDDSKKLQCWNIREQAGLSRTQNVALVVSQVLPLLRERALQGLSKTRLVLMPAEQDAYRRGVLIGYPEEDIPVIVQFEDHRNSTQFWSQTEALSELQSQLMMAMSNAIPVEPVSRELPDRPGPAAKKQSWFGRKTLKAPEMAKQHTQEPVEVDVRMDEIYFRAETEFGLYETLGAKVVMVMVIFR